MSKKIANKVADRFKKAHLSVKIPVNYALVVNFKKMLLENGIFADEGILEEILSRYLDLVVYGLCNNSSPSKEDLLNVASEVLEEIEDEELDDEEFDEFEDEDFDDEEDEGRF